MQFDLDQLFLEDQWSFLKVLCHFLPPNCFNLLPGEAAFQPHPSLCQFSSEEIGEDCICQTQKSLIPEKGSSWPVSSRLGQAGGPCLLPGVWSPFSGTRAETPLHCVS